MLGCIRTAGRSVRLAAVGSAWLGSARIGLARRSSARLGSARLGSARLGSASARLGSAQFGLDRLGLDRDNSARLDPTAKNDDPTKRTVRIWLDKASGRRRALILRLPTSRNAILDGSEKHFPGSRDDFGTAKEPPMSAKLRPLQSRILKIEHFSFFSKNCEFQKTAEACHAGRQIPCVPEAANIQIPLRILKIEKK